MKPARWRTRVSPRAGEPSARGEPAEAFLRESGRGRASTSEPGIGATGSGSPGSILLPPTHPRQGDLVFPAHLVHDESRIGDELPKPVFFQEAKDGPFLREEAVQIRPPLHPGDPVLRVVEEAIMEVPVGHDRGPLAAQA